MLDTFTRNWPLKLLSVGLAFGIWVSVTGESEIVQDFHPPLDIRLADERILATDPPTTVTVRLRGTQSSLRKIDALRLAVGVDLRDGIVGQRDISLGESNLAGVPGGVELDFISPDRLSLTVDRRIQRRLPVEPTFLGQPPEGYTFYGAEIRPDELLVEGPEAEVQSLEVLRTNPIRLDQFTEPGSRRVSTVPDSPHVHVVDLERLHVRVLVDTTPVEKTFENVPVVLTGQRFEAEVSTPEITVTMSGPVRQLNQIQTDLLQVHADLTDLEPRTATYDVELTLFYNGSPLDDGQRIKIKSLSRRSVRVRIHDRSFSL